MNRLNFENVIECNCDLGEGLAIGRNSVAWVDINEDTVFIYRFNRLRKFKTQFKPSVIYSVDKDELVFGSDVGICHLHLSSGNEQYLNFRKSNHSEKKYRSNEESIKNARFIYRLGSRNFNLRRRVL